MIGIDNKQVFVRHRGVYARVNPCNLQLVNDPVKDYKRETVDKDSPDVQNYSKENQNINTDMIIEVDTENVSNEFEEQKYKENKDRQVNEPTDTVSSVNKNLTMKVLILLKPLGTAPAIKNKVTYQVPDSKEWKKALITSR